MSKEYDDYFIEHKANVKRAFAWMKENIPEILTDCKEDIEYQRGYRIPNRIWTRSLKIYAR